MQQIRVFMAEMPRMLRELVEVVLASEYDLQLVGELREPDDLPSAAVRARADVIILESHDGDPPPICDRVLCEIPHATVLVITADARGAFRYELRPQKVPVTDLSPQGLVDAIRSAARSSICSSTGSRRIQALKEP